MLRTIGLMSGTSLDGVDAAWIETDGERIGQVGPRITVPYDDAFQGALRRTLDGAASLAADDPALRDVTVRLTEFHARAVEMIGMEADLIGFHGQTILHRPEARRTWQIGDPALLARMTGADVACDFRLSDVAAGGQGAPFAPVYHAALAADLPKPLAVLNLGGVGNVTWIGQDGELIAFDTGPGNGPLDDFVRARTGARYDAEGALATAGQPDEDVLARLLADPYFGRPHPKSLDRLDFERSIAGAGLDVLSVEDGAATLAAFTARSVALASFPEQPLSWVVTGGGRHNRAIMAALAEALGEEVLHAEAVGWDGDALEAQCFGYLAARVAAGLPLSFPGTTGVPAPMRGGRIVRAVDGRSSAKP